MSFTRAELEQKIEWRELLGRTKEALTRALGREPSTLDIVLISEDELRLRVLANLEDKSMLERVMNDLKDELKRHGLRLGMRESELPRK